MNNSIIRIKCPNDGAVLSVKYSKGMESQSVTCPVCQTRMPFTRFQIVSPQGRPQPGGDDATNYGGQRSQPDDATRTPADSGKPAIGRLRLLDAAGSPSSTVYALKAGRNILGRQATSSSATLQLPTGQDLHMSREHLIIDVTPVKGVGYRHCASLFKARCNDTYINGHLLAPADKVILQPGNEIRLPGISLRFELSDTDDGSEG